MKKKFIIATLFSAFLLIAPNAKAASYTDNQTVDANKTWTIKFTGSVGFDDSTKQDITVTDSKGNPVSVGIQLGQDGKTIIVTAPQGGYKVSESYKLNIGYNAHSIKGKKLKNKYMIHFNIKSEPEIKSIAYTDGEIRIRFDRPMDIKTAINSKYYQINDKGIDGAKIELIEDNTVVKITNLPNDILDDTTNILLITNNVKDTYGNKMNDYTRLSFDKEKDETKPTILSAAIIDSTTLRVQFSEDVRYAYATNIDNYQLKDADGVDMMKKTGVYIKASSDTDEKIKNDTDIYDIKLDKTVKTPTSTYKLDSSKYTLTVRDIIDKATEPNKMDDQVISIDGSDDIQLSVEAFKKSNSEAAICFGTKMDLSSITDKRNYYYINGNGDTEDLPDNVDITVGSDNKSVVIDFKDTNKTVDPSATSGDNFVKKIGIKTVKDVSGKEFYPESLTIASTWTTGPKLEENTFKLYKNGDDVKAEFQLDNALDTINCADFKVSGIVADDAELCDGKVTLTFSEGNNADAVLALGSNAMLQINPSSTDPSKDAAGRTIEPNTQKLYYNSIAPETDRDNYSAKVTVDGTTNKVTDAKIYITLKTPVDPDIIGAYKDDFIFINRGTKLDVEYVKLDTTGHKTTLVFTIKDPETKVASGDRIGIIANIESDDIDLRSQKDGNGNYVIFVPTYDDLIVKTVRVTEVHTSDSITQN
ncbi:Ig-like domain-containing protein [Clostridium sp. A1-XYC3]|uniref:Ig-like domain-containing protein n=1 Tax=Clostridium tanneri TaxID=3037988 RepID=A0ABU4JWY3_9CLOT|nr:Ig-like domain-containing protein [Clostridium sp. A1-XYC3]MDW8802663.1 Ig-like domain-containing protein [Clostridium sp. A1-XYC3]